MKIEKTVSNIFDSYLHSVSGKFRHKETSEMGYRADFETLLKQIFEEINVKRIDHDARAKDGSRPDFIVLNHDVPILYVEAKDIGIDLDKIEKSEQMARYFGYANLILTDYVEFRFYRNGLKYEEAIKVAEYDLKKRTIKPLPDNYEHLRKSVLDFTQTHKEPIRTAEHLSKIMGGKAQRIRDNVKHFLTLDTEKNTSLIKLYKTIKKLLVHELDENSFADMYAQTLVYGLFVARYHDESPDNFTRQEARELVPKSNPLLRHFFDHILGLDYDVRLKFIVDELCVVFSHANVQELMKQYFKDDFWGKTHEGPDPVIHFYEDFLKEYDQALRKKIGAFYTPLPVVRFIVRSVDYILENDFKLTGGLSDSSKSDKDIHKVQILDPASGTGTFITEILKNVHTRFTDQKGRWPKYVFHDLLPRVHGFELMMAPYTIAHLKLSMFLRDTGFRHFNNARLGIYLTNSLEESNIGGDLFSVGGFAESIAQESQEASLIKNETPIMVVIGNPPYSISSSNKSDWIINLIKVYKKDLNEQKINLDDDYIKFIRFAEHFIEKNKTGIVAMITNNSFIDGITHRQMRKHLLETFDDIYILDLHGNSKKKEKSPDGSKDENVFDIMQGVSINIFVRKNKNKKGLGNVYHSELFGKRERKFKTLDENNSKTTKWKKLKYTEPYYFFVPKDFRELDHYDTFFSLDDLFLQKGPGCKTERDSLNIKLSKNELENVLMDFMKLNEQQIRIKYNLFKDSRDWKVTWAMNDVQENFSNNIIKQYTYRPFDTRYIYYSGVSKGFVGTPGFKRFSNMLQDNIGIIYPRMCKGNGGFQHGLLSKFIVDVASGDAFSGAGTFFAPLYLYPLNESEETLNRKTRRIPNLNKEITKNIVSILGLDFVNEKEANNKSISPFDILDYIYAILYSPSYRENYKEFLKIDFPRIPYPKDKNEFYKYVKFGNELRLLHLMETPKLNKFITTYSIEGSDTVDKITFKDGNVYINSEQYFGKVPEIAWNFYIGGYQPAQKWLKDRKGRTLTNEDIEHYQKIIIVLMETDRIMKEIG